MPPPNSWANNTDNDVAVWNISLDPNTTWTVPKAKSGLNRTLYYYKGKGLTANSKTIEDYHAIDVLSDHEIILKAGDRGAKLLMLQGKPINEPVVQHGPFVMNTKQEIMQAFQDYQRDEFGGWPWPRRDQVHDRAKGRFAKHANGKEEIPNG
jgi:redox-sensitive bicupin YhaK (pirin superfamily)